MELTGDRLIAAPLPATWAALNDPDILKDCISGCESLERTEPDTFMAVVAVKVGPVSARFKGRLQMSNVQAPTSYTINFDGQGGPAGFGKGSADVNLSEEEGGTRLRYVARAQVGGKMAQIGSRLIDAAATKVAEDFFTAFEARLRPPAAPPGEAAPAATQGTASGPAPPGAFANPWLWAVAAILLIAFLVALLR
ncbi:MAG TPA: carbon monoxide dehydrogenase subunit G [Albitalea sp.]